VEKLGRRISERNRAAVDELAGYSRRALAHLAVAAQARQVADAAAGQVASGDSDHVSWGVPRRGEVLDAARQILAAAEELLRRAVVYERERGMSWEEIGEAFEISRQSAHARYADVETQWRTALRWPFGPDDDGTGIADPHLPDGVHRPTESARLLDGWAARQVVARRSDLADLPAAARHLVSGGLSTLSTTEETARLLEAIRDAAGRQLHAEDLARLHDRKATVFDRIAAESSDPQAAEAAAGARAYAAELRTADQGAPAAGEHQP